MSFLIKQIFDDHNISTNFAEISKRVCASKQRGTPDERKTYAWHLPPITFAICMFSMNQFSSTALAYAPTSKSGSMHDHKNLKCNNAITCSIAFIAWQRCCPSKIALVCQNYTFQSWCLWRHLMYSTMYMAIVADLRNCKGYRNVVRILKDANDSREKRQIFLLLDNFLHSRHIAGSDRMDFINVWSSVGVHLPRKTTCYMEDQKGKSYIKRKIK